MYKDNKEHTVQMLNVAFLKQVLSDSDNDKNCFLTTGYPDNNCYSNTKITIEGDNIKIGVSYIRSGCYTYYYGIY